MYTIPEHKKNKLKEPIGQVVTSLNQVEVKGDIVTVGDMVTKTIKDSRIEPKISIVDYKIERKEYKGERFNAEETMIVNNPPGRITRELWTAIATAYTTNKKTVIEVKGEEDLAALPAIYLAPENTTVIYGLPKKGMVVVNVGAKERKKVGDFLIETEE